MKFTRLLSILLALFLLTSTALPSFADPSEVLFCSACGSRIPPESKYCYSCGTKVTAPVSTSRTFTSGYDMDVGDILVLGSVELDGYYTGGEAIEWLVLAREGDRLLLISQYALCALPFCDETSAGATWAESSLRAYLNGQFLEKAFTEKERAMIVPVAVPADPNPYYDTDPGAPTEDKVFLLSADEAYRYFPSAEARACENLGKAPYEAAYRASNGNCAWWLRTPGLFSGYIATVDSAGAVSWYGSGSRKEDVSVRPAMWVDLSSEAWHTLSAENDERDRYFAEKIRSMGLHDVQDILAAVQAAEPLSDGPFPLADPSSVDAQIQLILDNLDLWYKESGTSAVLFTVADFDHNGRLEIVYAENYGSGNHTNLRVWEVNSGLTGLNSLGNGITSCFMLTYGESSNYQSAATPDLIPVAFINGDWKDLVSNINAYYLDPSGTTYYALHNVTGSLESAEELNECLVLENGELRIFPVAWRQREGMLSSYYDYLGNPIGHKSFADWESVFEGYHTRSIRLHWITTGSCSPQTLLDAYEAFSAL